MQLHSDLAVFDLFELTCMHGVYGQEYFNITYSACPKGTKSDRGALHGYQGFLAMMFAINEKCHTKFCFQHSASQPVLTTYAIHFRHS